MSRTDGAYTGLTAASAGWAAGTKGGFVKRAMIVVALAVVAAAAAAGTATASAPPVGKLPRGTTVTLKTIPGKLVVFTLPRPTLKGGVWRVARSFDTLVVQQRSERK